MFVPLRIARVAALSIALSALGQSRQATYLVSLRNIENQRYPNGSDSSPRNLLIPEVLSEIRRLYEIPNDVNINEAINVAYDSPIADGIAKSYQQRLSARNLTQAEIEALNERYLQELKSAMRSALRISVDYPALGIASEKGMALAADLPRLWTTAAQAYLNRLRLDVGEKKRQVQAFDSTMSSLGDYQRSGRTEKVSQRPFPPAPIPQVEQGSSIQIGDSAFSGIVEFAEREPYADFVRRVLDERRDLMVELPALGKESQFATPGTQGITVSPAFVADDSVSLNTLTSQYSNMLRLAEDLPRPQGGELFGPLLDPRLGDSPLISLRSLLIVAAAALAGFLLSVTGVLVAGTIRRPLSLMRENRYS